MKWREDNVCIKNGTVLSLAKADAFVSAIFERLLKILERFAGLVVLFGIKDRNRFADDLGLCITFDLLGAFVPTHDSSFGVDEEDGVIFNMLDQEAEALFELEAVVFRCFSAGKMMVDQE